MNESPNRSEPTREDFYARLSESIPEVLEQAPCPSLLDVIRINGRWAQVGPSLDTINFLDDNNRTMHQIDWNAYKLTRKYKGVKVAMYRRFEPEAMTNTEAENIYWGEEQKENPDLKKLVAVFGEYERKESIT
jgi:hypothetical protein